MWCAPTTTPALLTHVIRGAQDAGFTGLMVVLARTADASAQLHELSEEWTSVHDVTGHLIAVLSPDPRVRVPQVHAALIRDTIVHESAAMHDLHLVSFGNRDLEFSWGFTDSVNRDSSWYGKALPPRPPQEHRTAWTEAASRCASYFGITEAQMPAMLLLSFAERTAVLARLRPRSEVSLYDLCKQVAADLGYTKRGAELLAQQRALRPRREYLRRRRDVVISAISAHMPGQSPMASQLLSRMTDKLQAQYDGLDQHLRSIAEVDPELVTQWRTHLAALRSHGTVEEMYRHLFAIRRHVIATPDRQRWLRLAARLGKVIAATDRVVLGGRVYWELNKIDPFTANVERKKAEAAIKLQGIDAELGRIDPELTQIEDELSVVGAELAANEAKQDAEPGLASATMSAARQLLGPTETDTIDGSAGLAGYTLHVIRPVGDDPAGTNITNSVSGDVSGPVVQAGRIVGDVHIHQSRLWTRVRRWFNDQ